MKRLILSFLGSLFLITLTGCEGMKFARFEGEQKSWPTGSAFTDGVFAVPVYRGWPEKAYTVLGFVRFANPNIDWNRGDMEQAAARAKEAGGDAIILLHKGADPSPTTATTRANLGISADQTAGVVVKWK